MNCRQFTSLIVEAARGRMMDAATRDGAMRHADACAACAARLAQEQNLTRALRTVAAGMKEQGAPARVEAKLLAAFRESRAAAHAPATTTVDAAHAPAKTAADAAPAPGLLHANGAAHAPVAATDRMEIRDEMRDELAAKRESSRAQRRRGAFLATAVAASLALVALVTLYRQFTRTAPTPELITNAAPQGNAPQAAPSQGNAPQVIAPQATASRVIAPQAAAPPSGTTHAPDPDASALVSQALAPAGSTRLAKHDRSQADRSQPARHAESERASLKIARGATPRMIASRGVIDGGSAVFAAGEGEAATSQAGGAARPHEAESLTEFMPLVAGAPAAPPLESGQLVRVELPRAALASLGVPLNAERGDEPVKAEVLLGGDGLARAIRFVR